MSSRTKSLGRRSPPAVAAKPAAASATRVVAAGQIIIGPLPSPQMLAEYSDAVPDGGQRIVANWESESRHRREMEALLVRGAVDAQKRGQRFGLAVCALVIGGGIGVAFATGSAWVAVAPTVMGLAAVVRAFSGRDFGPSPSPTTSGHELDRAP